MFQKMVYAYKPKIYGRIYRHVIWELKAKMNISRLHCVRRKAESAHLVFVVGLGPSFVLATRTATARRRHDERNDRSIEGGLSPMPLTGEYEPSTSDWAREQTELFESSGGTEGNTLRGMPIIVMASLGARSGKLRKTPLMRVEQDGEYAVVASLGS